VADLRRGALAVLLAPLFLLLLGTAPAAHAAPATPRVAAVAHPAVAHPAVAHPAVAHPAAPSLVTAPNPAPTTTPSARSPRPSTGSGNVSVNLDPGVGKPSQTVSIILLLTVLSIAPALLVLCTAFTKVIVVLSLTRNALGTPTIPPNQVLAGLALFLSLFIMAPVLSQMNDQALQPYLKGEISQSQAFDTGVKPLRTFMLKETRKAELTTMIQLSKTARPAKPEDVPLTTLIPAFVLSELKSAFIIGFVIFIPFLVIDLVVSSSLMSMGMMMLPPVLISLPFKLLLFVMVDGWDLIAKALVTSYH
jgi:flagellar biosynthetic protein FliP